MKIAYDEIEIFNSNKETLKKISEDSSQNPYIYMTESDKEAICFDKVNSNYIKGMKLPDNPESNDALYIVNENEIYFIEFKNGKLNNKDKIFNLYEKIYNSLLIFTDITKADLEYCRNHLNYILVYNESKNPTDKNSNQDTSKNQIAKHFSNKAGKTFCLFHLNKFEKIYFKKVLTYTEKEFEKFISD